MKNIILCFDGTDNKFGPAPYSNVLKLFRMLDKESQLCYYQPGIGASMNVRLNNGGGIANLNRKTVMDVVDSMIACTLGEHITRSYRFLVAHYEKGDAVYMFGFSRGAFIARVLSSMLGKVGLLHRGLEQLADSAWDIYNAWEYAAQPSQPDYSTTLLEEYKRTFSRRDAVDIKFIGIFDTVNSVGFLTDKLFPYSCKINHVRYICHAVSLDERRGKFKQNLLVPHSYRAARPNTGLAEGPHWYSPAKSSPAGPPGTADGPLGTESSPLEETETSPLVSAKLEEKARRILTELDKFKNISSSFGAGLSGPGTGANTNGPFPSPSERTESFFTSSTIDKDRFLSGEYQELWFAGDHCDVGGSWPSDCNGQFSSNLSLRWIISEAIKRGVLFEKSVIVRFCERYSATDSLLSCVHDVLSLRKFSLTHQISRKERAEILKYTSSLFNKNVEYVPDFRSCEMIDENQSLTEFFLKNVYLSSVGSSGPSPARRPSPHKNTLHMHRGLPDAPVAMFDGRGDTSLVATLLWWAVELLPVGKKIQNEQDVWMNHYMPNFGRARCVPEYAKVHWSVYWRMRYGRDYRPGNLPEYVRCLVEGREFAGGELCDGNAVLVEKAYRQGLDSVACWDRQHWAVVPDELTDVLQQFGYYHLAA